MPPSPTGDSLPNLAEAGPPIPAGDGLPSLAGGGLPILAGGGPPPLTGGGPPGFPPTNGNNLPANLEAYFDAYFGPPIVPPSHHAPGITLPPPYMSTALHASAWHHVSSSRDPVKKRLDALHKNMAEAKAALARAREDIQGMQDAIADVEERCGVIPALEDVKAVPAKVGPKPGEKR